MKKGYWVVAYHAISDEAAFKRYSELALPAVQAVGAKLLIRALPGTIETRESGLNQLLVVVEFDSLEKAVATYDSDAYEQARAALGSGADRDFRIVEGAE